MRASTEAVRRCGAGGPSLRRGRPVAATHGRRSEPWGAPRVYRGGVRGRIVKEKPKMRVGLFCRPGREWARSVGGDDAGSAAYAARVVTDAESAARKA